MFSKYSVDESAIMGLVTSPPGKNVPLCAVIVLFKQKGKTHQVCLCHSLCSVCLCFVLLLVVVFFCFLVRHLFHCLFKVFFSLLFFIPFRVGVNFVCLVFQGLSIPYKD